MQKMSTVDDVIREMEAVECQEVPTISTAEAAVFTQRLIEAREACQEREVVRHVVTEGRSWVAAALAALLTDVDGNITGKQIAFDTCTFSSATVLWHVSGNQTQPSYTS